MEAESPKSAVINKAGRADDAGQRGCASTRCRPLQCLEGIDPEYNKCITNSSFTITWSMRSFDLCRTGRGALPHYPWKQGDDKDRPPMERTKSVEISVWSESRGLYCSVLYSMLLTQYLSLRTALWCTDNHHAFNTWKDRVITVDFRQVRSDTLPQAVDVCQASNSLDSTSLMIRFLDSSILTGRAPLLPAEPLKSPPVSQGTEGLLTLVSLRAYSSTTAYHCGIWTAPHQTVKHSSKCGKLPHGFIYHKHLKVVMVKIKDSSYSDHVLFTVLTSGRCFRDIYWVRPSLRLWPYWTRNIALHIWHSHVWTLLQIRTISYIDMYIQPIQICTFMHVKYIFWHICHI